MKKLFFAALIMLLSSCQDDGFNYFFTVTTTYEKYCGSSFDFAPTQRKDFYIKDISEAEAEKFQTDKTFEHIVTITVENKQTKAICRSECNFVLTRE